MKKGQDGSHASADASQAADTNVDNESQWVDEDQHAASDSDDEEYGNLRPVTKAVKSAQKAYLAADDEAVSHALDVLQEARKTKETEVKQGSAHKHQAFVKQAMLNVEQLVSNITSACLIAMLTVPTTDLKLASHRPGRSDGFLRAS